ncbi:26S protease regulatory subunit 7 [Fasciola hepatica]|uniref:26S protease regulatory subunit 7 n=1 Tax=Fasciola hepatica TaxID=6192 RepID=A0A4E0RXH4_FASHE|nr:26S protease regulatory subunit 7 [Fasciola hepatica]
MQVEYEPDMTRRDVGGCEEQFGRSPGITGRPCFHPNQFVNLEAEPPKDMLLFSDSGGAEKHRVRAVVNRTKAFLICVISSKLVKRYFEERACMVRKWFESDRSKGACILTFEEDIVGGLRYEEHAGGDNKVRYKSSLTSWMYLAHKETLRFL